MDIKDFNEALYASSNGAVVERRQSIIIPIIIFFAGVGLLVVNSFIENGSDVNNLKSALVLFGGAVALIGGALCCMRTLGGGTPYYTKEESFLSRHQYSFDRAQYDEVVKAVEKGDKSALDAIEESSIAGISVVCYYSPKSNFCAMQAFAYEEFVYKAITSLKITQ